jgi:hypothetical protein
MASDVDALFKLPLGEFTAARNALVSRLKKAGQQTEAAEAKALPKPSVSAWVVNQLYWRHGYLFGRLFDAGERLRHAQTARQASNLNELVNARREVMAALATNAADILREGGYSETRDVMRRVASTLEALSAYGSSPDAPSAGRLTVDLEPPGFETLAGLVPPRAAVKLAASKSPTSARQPSANDSTRGREQPRLVAEAKSAVRKAERELGVAQQHAERAAAALKTAAARAKKSEAQRVKLEKQFAAAAKEAGATHEHARAAEGEARDATLAMERAQRELQLARGQLERLAGKQD